MACASRQDVAPVKSRLRRRSGAPAPRVEGEIDIPLFRLGRQLGGWHLHDGQAAMGRRRAQAGQCRQQHGVFTIVECGHAPCLAGMRGIEGPWRRHRLGQGGQGMPQGLAQFFRAGGGPHAARTRKQQGVREEFAQAGQLQAHGRL